jgi:hypothetical protein
VCLWHWEWKIVCVCVCGCGCVGVYVWKNVRLHSCVCVKFVHALRACAFVCVSMCVCISVLVCVPKVCMYVFKKCVCMCSKSVCTYEVNRKYLGVHIWKVWLCICGWKVSLKVNNFKHTFGTHARTHFLKITFKLMWQKFKSCDRKIFI